MEHVAQRPISGLGPPARPVPGPRYATLFQFLSDVRPDPLGYLTRLAEDYGDIVRIEAWPVSAYALAHPDHIKYVLQENNRNYWKGKIVARMNVLIGDGLFTSEGELWRRQRRLAQPAFHHQRIAGFTEIMTRTAASMLDRWRVAAKQQTPLDVLTEMSQVTLGVVGQALFSLDLSGDAADVGEAMLVALELLTERVMSPFPLPLWVPTRRHRRLRSACAELDRVVFDIIDRRRRLGAATEDLLSMLMSARDPETGEGMSDQQLRDEVMTFVLAGHETTAVTLAWACHLLAQHRDVEERLRREVRDALGDRTPELKDLAQLGLARRVIEETLRLYPPVAVINRQAIAADEIGGFPIAANAMIYLSPFVTHRHPSFWEQPERFDPERFTPARSAARPRFAYFPFGGGPRLCIGNEFALMEAQLILAMIVQRYRLQPVPGHVVEPEIRITYRPRYGVQMVPQLVSY